MPACTDALEANRRMRHAGFVTERHICELLRGVTMHTWPSFIHLTFVVATVAAMPTWAQQAKSGAKPTSSQAADMSDDFKPLAAITPEQGAENAGTQNVAKTAEKERLVAVLDLRSDATTASIARALTVVVTAEVAAAPGYRAVSRNDLRSLLTHQADAQLLGCAEVQCMADIAKLVAADYIVAGSIDQIDKAHVFALELIDPSVPKVIERQTVTWRDDPDRMVELARPYVDRLLAGARAQYFEGKLEVLTMAGARVRVDATDIGTAPLDGPIQPLASGVHNLEVSLDGYVPFRQEIVVVRGETTLIRADLIDEESQRPWYARWWVWGSVGGGLALVGGATAAVVVYSMLSEPEPTSLEIVSQLPVAP